MSVCSTAQQKFKGYMLYSEHFYASAENNYAFGPRLLSEMTHNTEIGKLFTSEAHIDITTHRMKLIESLQGHVSKEEAKAKKQAELYNEEKEARHKAEKEAEVEKEKNKGKDQLIATL